MTRKILSQSDGPVPGYVTMLVEATIDAGVPVAAHTHPGIESAYVLEGGFELPIQGQATRMLKAGDGFQIPPDTRHAGGKPGDARAGSSSPMWWRRESRSHRRPRRGRGHPHSITSSASGSSVRGTGSSSMRAVPALMTSSYLVDGMIRRSAGFAPLRMRPT